MIINNAHCLFEQSGTFKNEFIKLGINALDYDILDEFNETDKKIDLYHEIDQAYNGECSIFDNIDKDDIIIAFFPCTRFQCIIPLAFRGEQAQMQNWSDEKKLENSMILHRELHDLYIRLCKLCLICIRGGYRCIIENPYTQPHYLTMFFPLKPAIIDNDRTENGDYYKKPTQYFFINCTPENNFIFEPLEYVSTKTIAKLKGANRKTQRSIIHPQYARRFIKRYLIEV